MSTTHTRLRWCQRAQHEDVLERWLGSVRSYPSLQTRTDVSDRWESSFFMANWPPIRQELPYFDKHGGKVAQVNEEDHGQIYLIAPKWVCRMNLRFPSTYVFVRTVWYHRRAESRFLFWNFTHKNMTTSKSTLIYQSSREKANNLLNFRNTCFCRCNLICLWNRKFSLQLPCSVEFFFCGVCGAMET